MNAVVEIPLTKGHVALIDASDADLIRPLKWSASIGTRTVYAVRGIRREDGRATTQSMHRLLTGYELVDHINGNGLDNRRSNLREGRRGNNMNAQLRSTSRSGFKGVSWCNRAKRWRACILANGKQRHLGFYDAADVAALAYDEAARLHFGPFATLNFPRPGERGASPKAA